MEKKIVTSVPINDWGLTFGYGLFETLRIYHGIPFLVEAHMDRLLNSCRELSFANTPDKETLIQVIYQYIKQMNLDSQAVRLSITYGNEKEGISPLIFLSNRAIPYQKSDYMEGVHSACSPYRKNEYSPIVQYKTFNQLENILALKKLTKDIKECIFLNSSGFLAEGSKSNLFFIREGKVFTPSVDCGILLGITRQKVIELLTGQGIVVQEGSYGFDEMVESDECFCTNSLMEIMPVVKIDDRQIGDGHPGKLSRFILILYRESVTRYIAEKKRLK
jgi:branched-chain amino acid aminotransferase